MEGFLYVLGMFLFIGWILKFIFAPRKKSLIKRVLLFNAFLLGGVIYMLTKEKKKPKKRGGW